MSKATEKWELIGGDFFGTEDGLISFADCEAAHTRSGQSFIPSVGGVTANNRMLDLGTRLAQVLSRLGVGKRTPSPSFHSDLAMTRDALKDRITKEERVSKPRCAVVTTQYNIPPNVL